MMAARLLRSIAVRWGVALALVGVFCTASLAEFKEVMVPMRDGVKLATNVFLPEGEGPWPVVLSRTPYNKGEATEKRADREKAYTERGYARVVQDCRGRFASEGEYRAFIDDMDDGYDTVEWIAAQPWSDGKVGMIGGSALGITANHAAMSGAPHLLCNVVYVGHGSSYHNSGYPGGVFLQNLNEEWLRRQGVPPADVPRPIHRVYDDSFRKRDIEHYFSKMKTPTINVGGWYDIFSQGNIDCFMGLQYRGAEPACGNQKLIMGAFGHGRLEGDLKYPADSAGIGDQSLALRWFDHWLKGEDNKVDEEPAVRYFLMGDTFDSDAPGNEWRTSDVWPPKANVTPYYFHAGGKLSKAAPAGDAPSSQASDTFVYDPKNPVPTVGGNNLMMKLGPMDQREVSGRDDVLKYETDPLSEAVEIVGPIEAELAVSTDAEDTDFMVKLVDVYPNGYEALVLDQAFRLRFREGFNRMVPAEKGKIYPIKVDLWSTALVFNKRHKIAVHVSSSNAPRFEPHSNTWQPVTDYDQAVKANNTVHHSAQHASRIMLPVTKVYSAETAADD